MARPIAAFILVVSMFLIGATAGGSIAALFSRSDMGFDEIASALTGMMTGGLIGIVVGIQVARRTNEARLRTVVAIAAVIALAIIAYGFVRIRMGVRILSGGGVVASLRRCRCSTLTLGAPRQSV